MRTVERWRPFLLVGGGGADLHGGDDLAPALDLGRRHDAWGSTVGALRIAGPALTAQQPIERCSAHRVELGGRRQQKLTLGMAAG